MHMRLKGGKSKVLTLSYDDCVIQDLRLMHILDQHGIKATFNINTGLYMDENATREGKQYRLKLSEAQALYIGSGHEIAAHTVNHVHLEDLKPEEIIEEVLEDKRNIEKQYGTLARGLAYPYGTYDEKVIDCLKKCGICYARTVKPSRGFSFPENWLALQPTCSHNNPDLMGVADKFVNQQPLYGENWLFYLWGHSHEFDTKNNWDIIKNFAQYIGSRDDVWYATNIEVYDYVKAYEDLQISADGKAIYNPSAMDVWFYEQNTTYRIKSGETILL